MPRRLVSLTTVVLVAVGLVAPSAAADTSRRPTAPTTDVATQGVAEDVTVAPTPASTGRSVPSAAGTYVVQLDGVDGTRAEVMAAIDDLGGTVRDEVDGLTEAVVVDLPAGAAPRLLGLAGVLRVEPDAAFTSAFYSWGVDRIDQRDLPLRGSYSPTETGAGVTIYVLDSGIDVDHPEFGGRARSGFNAVDDGNGPDDCEGHGTAVASAAGGASGVAPGVELVSVRVLDCFGAGDLSEILAGLDYVAEDAGQRSNRAVVNLSLGGGVSDLLDDVVRELIDLGVVVVAAAGNENDDACNYSPGRVDAVLTVGASTVDDERQFASNWGPCVDIFAPGQNVRTAEAFTASSTLQTGTSFAAPHVAGIVARHLQRNPSITPEAVHAAVVAAGTTNRLRGTQGLTNLLAYANLGPGRAPVGSATSCDAAAAETAQLFLLQAESLAAPSTGGEYHPAGVHSACLRGSAGTDHDLHLERFIDGTWQTIRSSVSDIGSDEQIVHQAPAGIYRWVVYAYDGSGTMALDWNGPGHRVRDASTPELASYHEPTGKWWETDVGTGAQRQITQFGTKSGWQAHVAADLTRDGRAELASYHPGNGRWWRTDTTTGAQKIVTQYGTPTGWAAHLAADMDDDGSTDLLSYHPGSGRWWLTDVSRGTARQSILTTYGTRDGWQTHRIGDLDGDDVPEIISYHEPTGRWWATEVRSDGRAASRLVTSYGTPGGWDDHVVGDVNGDGRPELLSYHASSGRWWSTTVPAGGGVASQRRIITYGTRTGWAGHLAVDTDGDGTDDIVSYNEHSGTWWRTGMVGGSAERTRVLTVFGTRTGWQTHLAADMDG